MPDAIEELAEQSAAFGGLLLDFPEAGELVEQLLGAVEVGVDRWADALDLLFERLAAHRVLASGEVAHHVEVLKPFELREQFATAVGPIADSCSGLGLDRVDHELAQVAVGAEVVQPLDELVLKRLGLDDRLVAAVAATPVAALVATELGARAARALHSPVAALAVQELAQQVVLGRAAGRADDAAPPRADLLHAVEQLFGHDRLVAASDLAGLVAQAGHVAAVACHHATATDDSPTTAANSRRPRSLSE